MEQTYLYSVHPRRPITDLSGVGFLRVPKSLQLTKDDVKKCLEKAIVYRRFANEGGKEVRVTINDLDRLHNAKYMTEEEYEKFLADSLSEGAGKVVVEEAKEESVVETPVATETREEVVVEAEEKEEVKEEEPVEEETTAEEPVEENQTVDTASETQAEEAAEQVVEETPTEKVEEENDVNESTVKEVADDKVGSKPSNIKHHRKK